MRIEETTIWKDASQLYRDFYNASDEDWKRRMECNAQGGNTGGGFMSALFAGDLDAAFAHADSENLAVLEKVAGMTKREYSILHWGWKA